MIDLIFDREGNPMTLEEYLLVVTDMAYAHVGMTVVGDTEISTVWLGIDHSWGLGGPPVIFETMVFGGPLEGECWRYSTEEEARAGHEAAVEMVRLEEQVRDRPT